MVTANPVVTGDSARGIAQRVFFPVNSTIDPQLTVSLSDDSLSGFNTLGESSQLPDGMSVRYTSNRPRVVAVSANGSVVRAAHQGVATVTATVTYHGASARGAFVVDVQ